MNDLRFALRSLRANPGFTAAVVVALALGIGANTTMFSVLDALMLKAPAYVRDPGHVAWAYFRWTGNGAPWIDPTTSVPSYESLNRAPGLAATAAQPANSSPLQM